MADNPPVSSYRWVILGLAVLSQATVASAPLALGPLAPLFRPELGLTRAEVGFFASAISAGGWMVMLLGGTLTDRTGVRRVVSLGQMVRGASLLCMAAAASLAQAVAVLFAVGIGGGLALPGPTKAILEWFPRATRATAMGLKQTGTPIAGMLTASALPALALALGWRAALVLVGLLTIFGGVAFALLYRDPPWSKKAPPGSASMRTGLKVVLRNRSLWTLSWVGFLFAATQFGLITYLALYLNDVLLVPAVPDERSRVVAAGGFVAISQLGGLFGRVFWGLASDRAFRGQRAVVLGIIGGISALVSLGLGWLEPGCPTWLLSSVVFVAGASLIGWNGVYHALVAETVRRSYAGTAVGFTMTMVEAGVGAGPPLFGLVVDLSGFYQAGWILVASLAVAATLICLLATGERADPPETSRPTGSTQALRH